jgi:hypothetical protein
LRKPIEFVLHAIGEQTATLSPAASSDDDSLPWAIAPQPCEKAPPLGIALKPIQAQFDGGRFAPRAAKLGGHLACRRDSDHGANASDAFTK